MEVKCTGEEGIHSTLNVDLNATLKELKLQIAQDMQIPIHLLVVSFKGNNLIDEKRKLTEYGLTPKDNKISVTIAKVLMVDLTIRNLMDLLALLMLTRKKNYLKEKNPRLMKTIY